MAARFILVFLICVSGLSAKKPNIVLIYADDFGYVDVGFNGGIAFETPNLDRIAKEGMIFTNAYAAAANCAPSRACLMTGKYAPRHGIYTVGKAGRGKSKNRKVITVENKTILDPKFETIAKELDEAGYRNCVAGKWHLSDDPLKYGFHTNFGGNTAGHPKSYFSPYRNANLPDGPKGEHLPERLGRDTAKWIEENREDPFFVYLPFYSVHTPIQAPAGLTKKYEKKYGDQINAKYAAMVESMDQAVGRILKTLDQFDLTKNTLVIFTSDNGPLGTISKAAPLRGSKGMYYEGGIRIPFAARWPGKIAAGTENDTPIHQVDLYPTLLAAAGADSSSESDGVNLIPVLSGKKLTDRSLYWHFPAYLEGQRNMRGSVSKIFRTTPCSVIRKGDWKLIQYFEDDLIELYDLKNDLSETTNLAKKESSKAGELLSELKDWQKESDAFLPVEKNPNYRK